MQFKLQKEVFELHPERSRSSSKEKVPKNKCLVRHTPLFLPYGGYPMVGFNDVNKKTIQLPKGDPIVAQRGGQLTHYEQQDHEHQPRRATSSAQVRAVHPPAH